MYFNFMIKVFTYAAFFILSLLFRPFVSVKSGLYVFGSRGGKGFDGGIKHLFDVASQNPNINAVFLRKGKSEYEYMLNYYGFKSFFTVLRAEKVFITHSFTDVTPCLYSKKTMLINVWHGAPIKKNWTARPEY